MTEEIKRFEFYSEHLGENLRAGTRPADDGEWVRYFDHQHFLAAAVGQAKAGPTPEQVDGEGETPVMDRLDEAELAKLDDIRDLLKDEELTAEQILDRIEAIVSEFPAPTPEQPEEPGCGTCGGSGFFSVNVQAHPAKWEDRRCPDCTGEPGCGERAKRQAERALLSSMRNLAPHEVPCDCPARGIAELDQHAEECPRGIIHGFLSLFEGLTAPLGAAPCPGCTEQEAESEPWGDVVLWRTVGRRGPLHANPVLVDFPRECALYTDAANRESRLTKEAISDWFSQKIAEDDDPYIQAIYRSVRRDLLAAFGDDQPETLHTQDGREQDTEPKFVTIDCDCPLPSMVCDDGTCSACGAQVVQAQDGRE